MDVTQIPFAKHIGIERKEEGILKLDATNVVQNHIKGIHASAQFALAETQSGLYLQETFPELEGKVVGMLRASTVKYKNPATSSIYAVANLAEAEKEKFLTQLERKGRAAMTVHVEVKDAEAVVTMQGDFQWYIQKI